MSREEKQKRKDRNFSYSMKKRWHYVLKWFKKNEKSCSIFICLILSSIISFEAGFLMSNQQKEEPLIFERLREDCPSSNENLPMDVSLEKNVQGVVSQKNTTQKEVSENEKSCLFVGSVNSNKYHSPSCHWAKQIKPENRKCFASKEEAQSSGYIEGCIE
ncbi:MAG: hypothetical protein EOM19_02310 [Candidatus Moranbacteria bacterium]|nr:hypothetical protein [Candidatus Moranbacteria bacterium]